MNSRSWIIFQPSEKGILQNYSFTLNAETMNKLSALWHLQRQPDPGPHLLLPVRAGAGVRGDEHVPEYTERDVQRRAGGQTHHPWRRRDGRVHAEPV